MEKSIRRSPFAGTWYPSHPDELARLVDGFLDGADGNANGRGHGHAVSGKLYGLVSPHAGLVYSGPVAAAGYRRLRAEASDVDSVILIGPSHQAFFEALAVYPEGAFETPLGLVRVDTELARAVLEGGPQFRALPEVHAQEHSLEMQLPFLQRVKPDIRIVPIMMGKQSEEMIGAACDALVRAVSTFPGRVVLIASSDLSHYETRERARQLDGEVLRCLKEFDASALSEELARDHRHACGGGPIVAVMRASGLLGAEHSQVLRYGDSGDVSGDVTAVVGYVSAEFTGESRS
jgi:AmmeMemoRadiSam system protein B